MPENKSSKFIPFEGGLAPPEIKVPQRGKFVPFSDIVVSPEIEREASENLKQSRVSGRDVAELGSYVAAPAASIIGALGGPPGIAAGSGIGAIIAENLKRYAEGRGNEPLTAGEQLGIGGVNAALGAAPIVAGAGLRAAGRAITPTIVRTIAKPNPALQEGTEYALERGWKPTVGQATRGLAEKLERLLMGGAKRAREGEQAELIAEDFNQMGNILRQGEFPQNIEEYGKRAFNVLDRTPQGRTLVESNIPKGERQPSRFFEHFKTPEQTRALAGSLGTKGKALLKGNYWDNTVADKVFDPVSKRFNADWLIKEANDPNSIMKAIYSPDELRGMQKFARGIQAVSPDLSESGRVALGIRNGVAILNIARGKIAPGLKLEVGFNVFGKNILLNPRNAAIAARLPKIPPDSAEAVFGQRVLLKALGAAGVTGMVRLADGTSKPVQITEGGKFKDLE